MAEKKDEKLAEKLNQSQTQAQTQSAPIENASLNEPPGSNVGGEGGEVTPPEPGASPVITALDPDEAEIGSAD